MLPSPVEGPAKATPPTSAGKTPRILACVLCQHRKIKCDRNIPCSNCIKANVTCTPSTPAPARKRRRPNQDLQQRLARCEELLQEYATAKPPSANTEPFNGDENWKSLGKLIIDDSGVRFMDSYLWATVVDEVRAMREIIDDDEKEDESVSTPAEGLTPDHNTGLLLSDGSESNLSDLHPEPALAIRLWQTFCDRVNPLTKVLHVPSVQPLIVEAATNRANLPTNVEALIFSIYTMGAISLTETECLTVLKLPRDEAINRFSKGARVALMRFGIMDKYDLLVLQALVLYLLSLSGRYDRHAAWIFSGVVIRIAQKMGLHRDGESLGLSPFETEMRRRIWWQIVLLDAVYALLSGLGQSMLPRHWDTREPRNINDSDLFPTMAKAESKEGPTDMIFCLLNYEIAKLLMEYPGLEAVVLQNELGSPDAPSSADVEAARKRIDCLDHDIGEILRKYSDSSMGPIHELSLEQRPMMINKLRELICPPREQPEWGTEILTPKDNLFKIAITTGEHSLRVYSQAEKRGAFLWFIMAHFQVEVFLFMVGQLCSRTSGQLVDRAWYVAERFYHYHAELFKLSTKPHGSLAVYMLRAWKKREEVVTASTGTPPVKPWYIARLQELLSSSNDSHESTDGRLKHQTQTPIPPSVAGSVEMPWDNMMGFVDAGSVNWDMFSGNTNQPAAPGYSGFYGNGLGGHQSMNGWM
ncbi:fungal-specific transcription factor domain-containing protein [Xylariales sp. PMI_506]|nr:fungal-specific transcription factor domain-containing protein [Xylariales sp. PMI_506]